jgi:hypothetical protein
VLARLGFCLNRLLPRTPKWANDCYEVVGTGVHRSVGTILMRLISPGNIAYPHPCVQLSSAPVPSPHAWPQTPGWSGFDNRQVIKTLVNWSQHRETQSQSRPLKKNKNDRHSTAVSRRRLVLSITCANAAEGNEQKATWKASSGQSVCLLNGQWMSDQWRSKRHGGEPVSGVRW